MARGRKHVDFRAGVRYEQDEHGELHAQRDEPICDFCLGDPKEDPIRWSYPCGYVRLSNANPVMNRTKDSWGACDACHDLIEAGDFDGLFDRTFRNQVTRFTEFDPEDVTPQSKAAMRAETQRIWREFSAARVGPALAEGEYDPETGWPSGT